LWLRYVVEVTARRDAVPEHVAGALRAGLRYARYDDGLQRVFWRDTIELERTPNACQKSAQVESLIIATRSAMNY
jgi:hypothetical protein